MDEYGLTANSNIDNFTSGQNMSNQFCLGGWAYLSEKYEFLNWDDYSQYVEK